MQDYLHFPHIVGISDGFSQVLLQKLFYYYMSIIATFRNKNVHSGPSQINSWYTHGATINILFHQKKGAATHLIFQPKHSIFPPKWVSRDWEKRPPKNVVSNLWEFLTSHRTRSRLSSGVELAYTPTFFPQNRWTFVCVRLWKNLKFSKSNTVILIRL